MKSSLQSSDSHNASASLTGYLYQTRYALLRALEEGKRHPSHSLSIERFDDVAFDTDGKLLELIQTKHHGSPGDTTDSSADLWKTINIWTKRLVENPNDTSNTRFVFLTTNTAKDGSALSMLRQAQQDRNDAKALELLIEVAKTSKNKATELARKTFVNLSATMKQVLIRNIWVFDRAPNIINARDEIEAILHYSALPDQVENLTDHLEGWWFRRVVLALNEPNSTTIPLSSIERKVSELREHFRIGNLVLDEEIEGMPSVTRMPDDDRMFIHQMHLVDISQAERLATVHDYYRAYEQRSRWARENMLLDGETDRYDRSLRDAWYRRFLASTSDSSDDCDDGTKKRQGRDVFRWSREYQRPLRNRDEIWLSSGSFQILADKVKIGWHPDYEALLPVPKDEA